MQRRISSMVASCTVPAADTTFSSSISDPKSLHPNRSEICPTLRPMVTQEACRLGTLCRMRRAMATVRR